MKKVGLFAIMVIFAVFLSIGQIVIKKECNLPRAGDKYEKQQVEYIHPGDSGQNAIWHFNDITILNGNYSIDVKQSSDSLISILDNLTLYRYNLSNDTLYWHGFENNLTRLGNEQGIPIMIYPFSYGQSITDDYCFIGEYSKNMSIIEEGIVNIKADGLGTLLMPEDTLYNVLRICSVRKSYAYVADSVSHEILMMSKDTIPEQIEKRYSWYAPGYRYPIVEMLQYAYQMNDTILGTYSIGYICETSEQEYINATTNDIVLSRKSLFDTRNTGQDNNNDTLKEISDRQFVSTQTNQEITVDYRVDTDCADVEIVICDYPGHLFYNNRYQNVSRGFYRENIDISNIPIGDYLLVIKVGCDSKKQMMQIK